MKFLFLGLLLSFHASAQWHAEVALGIDGESWKIERDKLEDGRPGLFTLGRYELKLSVKKTKEANFVDIDYLLLEKKTEKVVTVAKGTESIDERRANEVFAKGEPGQPNAIITIKLKKP